MFWRWLDRLPIAARASFEQRVAPVLNWIQTEAPFWQYRSALFDLRMPAPNKPSPPGRGKEGTKMFSSVSCKVILRLKNADIESPYRRWPLLKDK
jgi:hypothetical protein